MDLNINRNITHFEPGMPDQPCYVQIPPALGGAMPGERFKATVINGVSLRMLDGTLLYVTGAANEDHVVVGSYNGRTYGVGRKAYVSWPD